MEWFYIALIAPAIWAFINLIDDNLIRKVYKNPFFGTILAGILGLFIMISAFFVDITLPSTKIIIFAMFSGFIGVCAYWFYFRSLLDESPSVTVAIWNLSPAFVPFLAYFFLKESLSFNQYFGFAIILLSSIGLSVISIKKFKFSKALYFMAFAAMITAVENILFKFVYDSVDFWSASVFVSAGMFLSALFFMIFFRGGRSFPKEFMKNINWAWLFVIAELLNIFGILVSNFALSIGPVSLVKIIEAVQPIYIIIYSLILAPIFPKLSRESFDGNILKKLFFMILILIGLYMINL